MALTLHRRCDQNHTIDTTVLERSERDDRPERVRNNRPGSAELGDNGIDRGRHPEHIGE